MRTTELSSWRDILGTPVAGLDMQAALRLLHDLVDERRFARVAFLNAHSANIANRDHEYRSALSECVVLPDGIGVDLASLMTYGRMFPSNLAGTDFVPALLDTAAPAMRVGLIGGAPGVATRAAETLAKFSDRHTYFAISDGYFKADDLDRILSGLAEIRPDILLVGMGVPLQEKFITQNLTVEHCTLAIGVGALLNFQTGIERRAPVVWRRLRMEWLYRLLEDPRRLWRRYVIGNPVFLVRAMRYSLAQFTRAG
jgi:exopolysaccharide biosynthesis WecB/TagA/CpsF family protein